MNRRNFFKAIFTGAAALLVKPKKDIFGQRYLEGCTPLKPITAVDVLDVSSYDPGHILKFETGHLNGVRFIGKNVSEGKIKIEPPDEADDEFLFCYGPDYYQICKGDQDEISS